MIENVVKYIKGNFADSRVFKDIEDWNERALQWLLRTGNKSVHNTTKKSPVEVFLLEKQHLKPVSLLLTNENIHTSSITRNVGKDNTIRFASNRYSVPLGTYGTLPENQVVLDIQGVQTDTLIIRKQSTGEVLAEHQISNEKGKLIQNRNHTRDRSKGIEEFKNTIISHFEKQEDASLYIDEICMKYARYRRDQLIILQKVIKEEPSWIELALQKCISEKLYSANDFRDVVHYLKQSRTEGLVQLSEQQKISSPSTTIQVGTRSLETYTRILGGIVS